MKLSHRYLSIWLYFLGGLTLTIIPGKCCSQIINLTFNSLNEQNGLSSNGVCYYLTQDSKGFIWAGNIEGLHRLDGFKTKVYKPQDGMPGSMGERNIQSNVYEDINGNLWFTTYKYLHKYERAKDSFKLYQLKDSTGELIEENYRAFFLEKEWNKLWLRAGNAIFSFNIMDSTDYEPITFPTVSMWFSVDTSSNGKVTEIWGAPWLNQKGLEYFSKANQEKWLKRKLLNVPSTKNKDSKIEVRNTLLENDSTVWVFSDLGLIKLNKNKTEEYQIYTPENEVDFSCHKGIFLDSLNLMISSDDSGLWLFNTKSENYTYNWKYDKDNPTGLLSNTPRGIFKDKQGLIWISHLRGGINVAYSDLSFLNPFDKLPTNRPYYISSIIEDQKDRIWVGTLEQGVFVFSLEGDLLQHFSNSQFNHEQEKHLANDSKGNIWCVTRSNCYLIKDKSKVWEKLDNPQKKQFISLLHTNSGRTILSATDGINEIIGTTDSYFIQQISEFDKYNNRIFRQLFQSSLGHIYIPFSNDELRVYRERNGIFEKIKSMNVQGLKYSFWEDSQNKIVYLGWENGLLGIDSQLDTASILKNHNKSSWNKAYGAITDERNALWITSSQGLWKYHPELKKYERFRKEDGLSSNEFSACAILKANDGQLWLGTEDGLCVFRPDEIRSYPNAPNVYIQELLVNSAPYKNDNVESIEELEFEYDQNTIAIELRAIGFYLPELNTLSYCLEGYENVWVSASNGSIARFSKIPPGSYIFKMKAVNANGIESDVKELPILISPPFWQRLWFKLAMTILMGLIILGGIQAYIQRKLRRQRLIIEKQEVRQAERDRIATDLHDDIGSGLSNIIFMSDGLSRGLEHEKQEKLANITYTAKTLVKSLKESIWALDTQNDTFEKLVLQIRSYLSLFFSDHPITHKLNFLEEYSHVVISGEKRRNIFLIIKESLHNIVKYADANEVELNLDIVDTQLICSIRDNGKGFTISSSRGKGHGLNNMQKRAEAIGGSFSLRSKMGKGTEIKISIPLKD